ncbi:Protein kinase superfamily protein [Striga hermonthica]|uniref:Protein kinase superfamily protein n=1 Tax=Striga hermonthica TaxID=68872 RepID=A0A9N7MDF5_STRHE|nr:Protein kinase superfamily protein [Striga hermonthica]
MATGTVLPSAYAAFFAGRKTAHRSKGPKGVNIKKAEQYDEDDGCLDFTTDCGTNKRRLLGCPDADADAGRAKKSKRITAGSGSSSWYGSIHDYECLDMISQGAYGAVYRARHKKTHEIVAVKKEFGGLCESTLTEISILRSIRHPSVVEYKQVVSDDLDGIYVVMEYMEYDLHEYLKKNPSIDLPQVKRLMKELLEGVQHLHEKEVMHRDLKPSNLLLNAEEPGKLKICDFGLSSRFEDKPCTPHVGTLWYRAPELFLGAHEYLPAVDMWSVGCIMAEFFLGKVLFRGESEIEQLQIIVTNLEQPHCELQHKFAAANALKGGPLLTQSGFELLSRLLTYSPQDRITAREALGHWWFQE